MSQTEELTIFFKEFDKNSKELEKRLAGAISLAAHGLQAVVEENSVVGDTSLWNYPPKGNYLPGIFKRSWTYEETNPGTLDIKVRILNIQPYGVRLEYFSWSTQAPDGFMRISTLEFGPMLNKAIEKALKEK
jgi:hypothetical protein